ncbi:MAG: energy-coupling factor transporter transmembrane protein EcfT [Chloroflexi bacterium]|nr:energy-coupling factor transporter transmembrane protein EcfT [Chloroflexota bacterium]
MRSCTPQVWRQPTVSFSSACWPRGISLHTLDPRAKLIAALLVAALIITGGEPLRLCVVAVVLALVIVCERLGGHLLKLVRGLVPMIALTFSLSWLAFGLAVAGLTTLRFATLVTLFFVFFQTTLPEDLGNSLVQWHVPYAFAFILTGGMQFAPVMARKAEAVADAQRARGLSLERGVYDWHRYASLLAPLLVQAFKLADELAEAMEARGFGAPQRTFLREYRWRGRDSVLVGATVGLAIISSWL